jgi:hypothetical protein
MKGMGTSSCRFGESGHTQSKGLNETLQIKVVHAVMNTPTLTYSNEMFEVGVSNMST